MSTLHLEVASFLKFKDAFDTSICDVRCFKINKRTKRGFFFYVLLAYSDTYNLNSCSVFLCNLSIIYWYTLEAQFLREKRSCFFVPIPNITTIPVYFVGRRFIILRVLQLTFTKSAIAFSSKTCA